MAHTYILSVSVSIYISILFVYLSCYLAVGMLPRNQVTPEQVETYLNVERSKRIQLLKPFFKLGDSSKVKLSLSFNLFYLEDREQ